MNEKSFKIVMQIFNMAMELTIKPVITKTGSRFIIETVDKEPSVMILKPTTGHTWIAENVTMKFFTKTYINQLGSLIESRLQHAQLH